MSAPTSDKILSLEEIKKRVFKTETKSELVVVFKGEIKKIKEFVAFHFIQGFQKILVYEHGRNIYVSDFGKLANFVEVHQGPYSSDSKNRLKNHMYAYHDAFAKKNQTDLIIGLIDADEYVWSNDYPQRLVPEVIRESTVDESLLYCPRFGSVEMKPWNPSQLIISQFTARSPFREAWNRTLYPDCKIKCTEPQGTCFESTHHKTIYSMLNLSYMATRHISVHGIVKSKFSNLRSKILTTSRTAGSGGLSCNHYFALDDINRQVKEQIDFKNSESIPTFYDLYAKYKQIQEYYVMYNDAIARDRFYAQLEALMAEAY